MGEELEQLKQRLPLLDYLRQQNWIGRPAGQGPDLIRFVELSQHLSFRQSLAFLEQQSAVADPTAVLRQASDFYQQQLDRYPQARRYLEQRGVRDPALIRELQIGYAPGGSLRCHLLAQGYSLNLLRRTGVIDAQGHDAFYQRVVFPCRQKGRIANL